jgi:hypothetical protein
VLAAKIFGGMAALCLALSLLLQVLPNPDIALR